MALRSARARGGAGFFFGLLLAPVARGQFFLSVKWLCAPRGPEAGLVFSLSWFSRWWRGAGFFFWSSGLRSARARGRAGFFFELVLALVAREMFFLSVKWLCAPRGPEAGLVFSLSWFSRWWRGAGFFFWSSGLRSARARGRAGFFFELVLALVAREMFFLSVKWLCAPRGPEVGRGVSNPPSLPLDSTLPATS